jgi:hypothetical protein
MYHKNKGAKPGSAAYILMNHGKSHYDTGGTTVSSPASSAAGNAGNETTPLMRRGGRRHAAGEKCYARGGYVEGGKVPLEGQARANKEPGMRRGGRRHHEAGGREGNTVSYRDHDAGTTTRPVMRRGGPRHRAEGGNMAPAHFSHGGRQHHFAGLLAAALPYLGHAAAAIAPSLIGDVYGRVKKSLGYEEGGSTMRRGGRRHHEAGGREGDISELSRAMGGAAKYRRGYPNA